MELRRRFRARRDRATLWLRLWIRRKLAERYIHGEGIEIGALHHPLPVPSDARVKYLDRLSTGQLRREYPELAALPLVDVEIVEDGEDPMSVGDESQDFVIASHMIEHCEDPIGTIANWLRILRPGGVIYLVVPDRRRTFDRDRDPTPVEHLLRDYREGPDGSRKDHYLEWTDAHYHEDPDREKRAAELAEQGYRIHFHVWSPDEFRSSLEHFAREESLPMKVAAMKINYREFMVIIEKT